MTAAGARLVAVAVLGAMLFNYPLLSLFDRPVLVAGMPLLWVYLFTAWAGVIAAVAVITRRGSHRGDRRGAGRPRPGPLGSAPDQPGSRQHKAEPDDPDQGRTG